MKKYVSGTRKRPQTEQQKVANRVEYDVGYTTVPTLAFTFDHRPDADGELALLQSWDVHVGSHRCHFEVEEMSVGSFAIVCIDHPE